MSKRTRKAKKLLEDDIASVPKAVVDSIILFHASHGFWPVLQGTREIAAAKRRLDENRRRRLPKALK